MSQEDDKSQVRSSFPTCGMSRWKQFAPFSPFSREKFRQLALAGKAPQPVRFSDRCTAYHNHELHKFFADPLNYAPPAPPICAPEALTPPSEADCQSEERDD